MTTPLIETLEKAIQERYDTAENDIFDGYEAQADEIKKQAKQLEAFKAMYVALKKETEHDLYDGLVHVEDCDCHICQAINLAEHAWEGRG